MAILDGVALRDGQHVVLRIVIQADGGFVLEHNLFSGTVHYVVNCDTCGADVPADDVLAHATAGHPEV